MASSVGVTEGGINSDAGVANDSFLPTGNDSDFDAIFESAPTGQSSSGLAGESSDVEPSLEEMLVDKATMSPEELRAAEEPEAPVAAAPKTKAAPAAAPDASQQFQLMMMQQMQQMQQQNQAFYERIFSTFNKPTETKAPSKFDITSVLPEGLRTVDGVPELAQAIYGAVEKQFADRDQASQKAAQDWQHQQNVNQWVHEAKHVSTEILKDGYKFANPADADHFGAMVRDLAISVADARGGTPGQYLNPIRQVIKAGVQAQIANMNDKTKANMQRRVPNAQAQRLGQRPGQQAPTEAHMSVPGSNRPTQEELRAVRMTAVQSALEGDHSVHMLRSKRKAGGQR